MREGLEQLAILTRETRSGVDGGRRVRGAPTRATNFTTDDRSDDAPVGTAGLFRINYVHSNAELGIAIGDRRGAASAARPRG